MMLSLKETCVGNLMEMMSYISAKTGKAFERVDEGSALEHFEFKDISGNAFEFYLDGSMALNESQGYLSVPTVWILHLEERKNEVLVRGSDWRSFLIVFKEEE